MTAWRKAVRDLILERNRSLLVVMAVALGIAAYSTVMSTYAILDRELNREYVATNPASATLRVDAADEEAMATVRSIPGVELAERGQLHFGRIKTGAGRWRSMLLFVVDDFAAKRIGTLGGTDRVPAPTAGEILIERDAFQVARAAIGDRVTVRFRAGDVRELHVVGSVHDVGQAQARMENVVYAYATAATVSFLDIPAGFDRISIVVSGDRSSRDRIAGVAANVKDALEARGHGVSRIDIPDPGKHPHADLMALLLLGISMFGLIVLALSGVLVFNLSTSIMAAQIRQIGIMKAIGASRMQIAGIYFAQTLCLGLAAVLVALPAGRVGAELLINFLARLLNFDIASHAVPMWIYGLVSIVGIAVPVLAAALPVRKGTAVPVAAAIHSYGVADRFGARATDRLMARIGGLSTPAQLSLRNILRRRVRTLLTVMTLSMSGVFFMSALNVRSSIQHTLAWADSLRRYDLDVSLRSRQPMDLVRRVIGASPAIRDAEGWIESEASVMADAASGRSDTAPRLDLVGIPPQTRMQSFEMAQGRALRDGDVDSIVLNTAYLRRHPGTRVGDTMTLRIDAVDTSWHVVGIATEPIGGAAGYVPIGFFEQLNGEHGQTNSLRVSLPAGDEGTIARAREVLDRGFAREGIREIGITSRDDNNYAIDQHMLMVYAFFLIVSFLIGGVGLLGLTTTMSLNVLERRRELGAMRAVGATPGVIIRVVVGEGVTLGVVSWIVASVLAWFATRGLNAVLTNALFRSAIRSAFDPAAVVGWLSASIALSALTAAIPAWTASRSSVRDAVAQE